MTDPNPVVPAANSKEAFQSAIGVYKQQHDTVVSQLAQLKQNYRAQKTQMDTASAMLQGAVVAIEQIITNMDDEAKANTLKAPAGDAIAAAAIPILDTGSADAAGARGY